MQSHMHSRTETTNSQHTYPTKKKALMGIRRSLFLGLLLVFLVGFNSSEAPEKRFVEVRAADKFDRSAIAQLGVSIEAVRTDSVWVIGSEAQINKIKSAGFEILGNYPLETARGGHEGLFGFPPGDSKFHTYDQVATALRSIESRNNRIAKVVSIGKSIENRDILAIHFNTDEQALEKGTDTKPGIIFMGNHHAREHLSVEIPLMLAEYLSANKTDSKIQALLSTRDIWIIPMVNPDGAEYDIAGGRYRWWRKNRRNNGDGTFGVDLNRNYGYQWGTGGSDTDPSSDVYMGKAPFSEPETLAIKNFVDAHASNTKVLLSFHTFSELILYPWGNTYDPVANQKDRAVYEIAAKTMAKWNHYKPQQSSDLYIASGDTTDWSYGEHGIFSFTFELSPSSMWDGGFYPGQGVIDRVFKDNLQPCLFLMDLADNPHKLLNNQPSGFLNNYVEPKVPETFFWQPSLDAISPEQNLSSR